MKVLASSLLFTLVAVFPARGETTLESLQQRCVEQERQILQLEAENRQLRDQLGSAAPVVTEAEQAPSAESGASYTVKSGDSLAKIAGEHDTTSEILARVNGIENPALIRPGQVLRLPAPKPAAPRQPQTEEQAAGATHVVRKGDTFYSISRQYGIDISDLKQANPKVDPATLRVGQSLSLEPVRSAPAPAQRESAPVRDEAGQPEQGIAQAANAGTEPAGQTVAHRPSYRTVRIDEEISFGDFALRHGMTPAKLNALNGLDLDSPTILAEGSELYVSAQPNSLP